MPTAGVVAVGDVLAAGVVAVGDVLAAGVAIGVVGILFWSLFRNHTFWQNLHFELRQRVNLCLDNR